MHVSLNTVQLGLLGSGVFKVMFFWDCLQMTGYNYSEEHYLVLLSIDAPVHGWKKMCQYGRLPSDLHLHNQQVRDRFVNKEMRKPGLGVQE